MQATIIPTPQQIGAQPLDADLTALAGLSTTGLIQRTGAGTMSTLSTGNSNGNVPLVGSGNKLAEAIIPGAGLLRAWALVELVAGAPSILASSQVSSVVKVATGIFDVTSSVSAPGSGYFLPLANGQVNVVENWSAATNAVWINANTATVVHSLAGTGFVDPYRFSVAIFW